jgi:hypothetical protein
MCFIEEGSRILKASARTVTAAIVTKSAASISKLTNWLQQISCNPPDYCRHLGTMISIV